MAYWRNLVTCYNIEASKWCGLIFKVSQSKLLLRRVERPSTVLEKRRLKSVCHLTGEIQNGIWLLQPHVFPKIPLLVLGSETPGIFCLKFQALWLGPFLLKHSNKASNRQQSSWKEKPREGWHAYSLLGGLVFLDIVVEKWIFLSYKIFGKL